MRLLNNFENYFKIEINFTGQTQLFKDHIFNICFTSMLCRLIILLNNSKKNFIFRIIFFYVYETLKT